MWDLGVRWSLAICAWELTPHYQHCYSACTFVRPHRHGATSPEVER
jgi:hypothetical protein